jgi:hypothetical protein
LLALQVLLAHADLALRPHGTMRKPAVSPRKVLIEIRKEIAASARAGRRTTYRRRLETCRAETRRQTSPKASREWPRRKTHQPPVPPLFLTMNDAQKALLEKHIHPE